MEIEDLAVSPLPEGRVSNRALFTSGSSSSAELEAGISKGVVSRDEEITIRLAAIFKRLDNDGGDTTIGLCDTLSETSEGYKNSKVFNGSTRGILNGYDILFRCLPANVHPFPSLFPSAPPLHSPESQGYPETW